MTCLWGMSKAFSIEAASKGEQGAEWSTIDMPGPETRCPRLGVHGCPQYPTTPVNPLPSGCVSATVYKIWRTRMIKSWAFEFFYSSPELSSSDTADPAKVIEYF